MDRELEALATQIYTEYNLGVDLEQFVPKATAQLIDWSGSQGPDVFAIKRLHLLKPELDVVGYAYRQSNPSAKVAHENPKRTVPAVRSGNGRITIFDPFLPDFVDGVEQRVYSPREHDKYPVPLYSKPEIVDVLFDKQ
jgi:hypothetical protein